MALIEVHVHNHVDTDDIIAKLGAIKTGVDMLVALATATSEADKAAILNAANKLNEVQSRIKTSVDTNPVPSSS